jgi:exonuclease SbcD
VSEFTFIHTADIHLDSPLRGLSRYEGAPVESIRGATREAFQSLVQTAIQEQVAFIVIAGDVFDCDWKDYNTGLFFASQMSKLRENGIEVYLLSGNHDAASRITRKIKMPGNVKSFSNRKPDTIILKDLGVALHGQGFARPVITENLVEKYPGAVDGLFNIGVLHTSATGRKGHEPYAPCNLEDLTSKGYDYWALGHVHKREVLCKSPWILFPGNIQGRHIRETGSKGCTIVNVESDGSVKPEPLSLDVIRWALLTVDCTGADTGEDAVQKVRSALETELANSEGRMLAARIELIGSCLAHEKLISDPERWISQIRAEATDISGGEVWVEKTFLHTTHPLDIKKLAKSKSPIGELLRLINKIGSNPKRLSELSNGLSSLKDKLPGELLQGDEKIDLESAVGIRGILAEARDLLLSRLLQKGIDQ